MGRLGSLFNFDDSDDDKFEAECPDTYEEGDRKPCFKDVECDTLHVFDKDHLCIITEPNDDGQSETTKYCCATQLDDCCTPDTVPVILISLGTFSFIVFALCLICKFGKRKPKPGHRHGHGPSKVDFLNEPLVEDRETTGFE
jgi:hypothetical protein